jgi:two-component system sensor histidine kinase PilS (NtrC family)
MLRNSAEVSSNHEIEVEAPDQPVVCEADEGQIRQIVWNLAINGLRAMPEGGRLRLSAAAEPRAGADSGGVVDVVLRVCDEGVGIPAEELDGLFQPFRRRFGRGSGLGLAIVHRIVSDYNGEIHVTSQPDRGTTVTVRLPAGSGETVLAAAGRQ